MDLLAGARLQISMDGTYPTALLLHTPETIEFTWSQIGRGESLRNLIVKTRHEAGPRRELTFVPVLETGRRSWSQMLELPLLGRYFRAYMPTPRPPEDLVITPGFEFVEFDPDRDVAAAVALMNAAYPSLRHLATAGKLQAMMAAKHFFPQGWFFLRHSATGERVGLTICGHCSQMREGFIEWTEILPRFRHRGLGALLVKEAINRLAERSDFLTASGSLDAPFAMGDLYMSCGFEHLRQWSILGSAQGAEHHAHAFVIPPGGLGN